jgi:hypothetical protein
MGQVVVLALVEAVAGVVVEVGAAAGLQQAADCLLKVRYPHRDQT